MLFITDNFPITDKDLEINPLGFFAIPNVKIANLGNVQTYKSWELELPSHLSHLSEVRIYRKKEDVTLSASKFNYLPLTDTHPWETLNINNFKEYSKGFTFNCTAKEDGLYSSIVVMDSVIMVDMQTKDPALATELSCGYTCDFVWESGVTEDGNGYDGYMVNIVGNHVALVERGRCGGSCSLWTK